tara:strand:- start:5381 stop:6760 length:1380 start_codon:yes stop_codon:yes gene_type:complete
MYIKQIYTNCLAQASYYIESGNDAVIIDPIRDKNLYLDLLKNRKTRLKYIFETHFHADFVSGHFELANLTNAKIVFGPNAKTNYNIIEAKDNQEFVVGDLKFRVLHTPGHTLESVCYLLSSKDDIEHAVFTGDTLFIGEVGRPDLAVNPTITSRDLACQLYHSLHNVLLKLPNNVIVYPGHGAGSACGKNISNEKYSTIGLQKKQNYALQKMSEQEFVDIVLDGISPAPKYFEHDVNMNRNGYELTTDLLKKSHKKIQPKDISEYQKSNVLILDVRMPNEFESGFIPGSINIGKTGMFAPWAATIIPPSKNLIIVCADLEIEEVICRLSRVGYENILGYITIDTWQNDGGVIKTINSIEANLIPTHIQNNYKILDVRKANELSVGYVKDSIHIPLDKLPDNLNKINRNDKYLIYCAGGYRSMIAASILCQNNFQDVKNIYGGFRSISDNQDSSDYIKIV